VDPEYVRQLEQQAQQQQAILNRLSPYADKIEYLVENPRAAEVFDVSRRAYEDELERRKPQVLPELKPVIDALDQRVAPLVSYVEQQRAEKERETQASQAAFYKASVEYADRLVAEKKIRPEDKLIIGNIADTLAAQRGERVSFEEAYKYTTSKFGGVASAPEDAPILRADSGAPGVPGESTPQRQKPSDRTEDRFVTLRDQIEKYPGGSRAVVQEWLNLAGLGKGSQKAS
jgi:hypothetical protein